MLNGIKKSTEDSLPWVEKYRPATLNDVHGHRHIVDLLNRLVETKRLPHLLFYGPAGTGKTSTIMALARQLYGSDSIKRMVLDLNASDDRGINVVRDQIKTFCSTGQVFTSSGTQQNNVPYKLVILDEADAMTSTAQMAIRRVIERYTANTRFCLIANYVHRLSPALLSRCTRFRFGPLKGENIRQLLEHVVQTEDVAIDEPALDTVATLSGGDLRRALNILQACHASTSVPASTTDDSDPAAVGDRVVIRPAMIYDCVAAPHPQDVKQIWQMLYNCQNLLDAYSAMTSVMSTKGIALPDLLTALMDEIMQLDISPHARVTWIEEFANIEYRVSTGGSESLQATAVMGIISKGVSLLAERK